MLTLPNLVTLSRPLLTLTFVWLVYDQQRTTDSGCLSLMVIYALIGASDIVDGWLARLLDQTSSLGRFLDHLCDITFILTALLLYVTLGRAPWWLPACIAWAFLMYVVDSWRRTAVQTRHTLLPTRLGHWGGILYFLTVGMITVDACYANAMTGMMIHRGWFTAVSVLAFISGCQRLLALLRSRCLASD